MREIGFELTGTTPLLMHADNIEAADRLKEWRTDPTNKNISVAGDDRSPPWTWQGYLYHDGTYLTIPSENLMSCLRKAGTRMIMKGKTTFKEVTQSDISVATEHFEFRCGGKQIRIADIVAYSEASYIEHIDRTRKLGFDLLAKRAKIGTSKHIRVRPRFDSWSLTGSITVTAPELTDRVLGEMFHLAGRLGLGDWRPGSPKAGGPYGMFTAKLMFD